MRLNDKSSSSSDLKRWMEKWSDLTRFNKKIFYKGHLSYMLSANQLIPKSTKDVYRGKLDIAGGREQMLLELNANSSKSFLLN